MTSPPDERLDTWHDALTRRLRALVRTGPLHRIESGKGQRALELDDQDLRALALRALDVTIEHMGLGTGARVGRGAVRAASEVHAEVKPRPDPRSAPHPKPTWR